MDRSERRIGNDMSKWYITKRDGRWYVCPNIITDDDGVAVTGWSDRGTTFTTGAEALATFAGGGFPLRVDQLTEACRQYEWEDNATAASRWYYTNGCWHWTNRWFKRMRTECRDEAEVAEYYECGPFTRITGPGVPA